MIYFDEVVVASVRQQEGGKGSTSTFQMAFRGKPSMEEHDSPYEVFNEVVASELARYLGLPVPDTFVVQTDREYYCFRPELNFRVPATEDEIFEALSLDSDLTHGIICCDVWVANNDRKGDNVLFNKRKNQIFLIDFGNSLLYRGSRKGLERLDSIKKDPHALFDKRYHYASLLNNPSLVDHWCTKIKEIPDWMIVNAVDMAKDTLLGSDVGEGHLDLITSFLIERKSVLNNILNNLAGSIFVSFRPSTGKGTQ